MKDYPHWKLKSHKPSRR